MITVNKDNVVDNLSVNNLYIRPEITDIIWTNKTNNVRLINYKTTAKWTSDGYHFAESSKEFKLGSSYKWYYNIFTTANIYIGLSIDEKECLQQLISVTGRDILYFSLSKNSLTITHKNKEQLVIKTINISLKDTFGEDYLNTLVRSFISSYDDNHASVQIMDDIKSHLHYSNNQLIIDNTSYLNRNTCNNRSCIDVNISDNTYNVDPNDFMITISSPNTLDIYLPPIGDDMMEFMIIRNIPHGDEESWLDPIMKVHGPIDNENVIGVWDKIHIISNKILGRWESVGFGIEILRKHIYIIQEITLNNAGILESSFPN